MKLTSSIPIIPQAALQPCSFPCLLVPFPRVRSLAFIILNIFTYLLIVSDLPTPLAFSPLCHVCTLPQHTLGPRALAGRSWGTGTLSERAAGRRGLRPCHGARRCGCGQDPADDLIQDRFGYADDRSGTAGKGRLR